MRFIALLSFIFAGPAFAGIVAPIPRGIEFPKPADRPVPEENKGEPEDPAAIVERIAKNAEGIGERLKEKDTGAGTREKQDQLLKDIDKLLQPPPPMDGGGGYSSNPPPPTGGSAGMPPPKGGGSGGAGKPRPQRSGSRPEPMPGTPKPIPGVKQPMGGMGDAANAGANPMGKGGGNSALPLEDPFTKQIWGHLPERLRQQASQYYREQYMPKYGELLKLYYSNLAEREKK